MEKNTPGSSSQQTTLDAKSGTLSVHSPCRRNTPRIRFPVPHPLDFDWRFSEASVRHLLDYVKNLSQPNEQVVLLGTPTILRAALEAHMERDFVLLEANDAILQSFSSSAPGVRLLRCDLSLDRLPSLSAQLVLADPPWYEDYERAFLWAASYLCGKGSVVLLSQPPLGIRPGIEEEWSRTIQWAGQIGLTLRDFQQGVLGYTSPPFEHNAFRAVKRPDWGSEWRKGDLAIFERTHECTASRPRSWSLFQSWVEHELRGVRWRIRRETSKTFADPRLVSVLPGDVLPSVSRRDGRRDLAEVWTSGNRIYKCEGRYVMGRIVQALEEHILPSEAVSAALGRKLALDERQQVGYAQQQIEQVVDSELCEYLLAWQG
jgi:hypothetical protein